MNNINKSDAIFGGVLTYVELQFKEMNEKGRDLEAVSQLADILADLTDSNKDKREKAKARIRELVKLGS